MTDQKTDRRIVRTKRNIMDAFTTLLEQKEFEKITIAELTEMADINRRTFYLHFQDIYDLLEQLDNNLIEEFDADLDRDAIKNIREFQLASLTFLKANQSIAKVLLQNPDSRLLAKIMQIEIDFHFNHSTFKNEIERKYCWDYIESGLKNILADWLSRETMSLQDMCNLSTSLIESSLAIHAA